MSARVIQSAEIRSLNDTFRQAGPHTDSDGRWLLTQGILALGGETVAKAIQAVRNHAKFDRDNDPHDEHDFGSFIVCGETAFWKIDYYDRSMEAGSPEPANPAVTLRVMTILLSQEY